jgi:ribosomal protein L37AE/L43A
MAPSVSRKTNSTGWLQERPRNADGFQERNQNGGNYKKMKRTDCPVCGKSDATKGADPYGREAVKFWCPRGCGIFVMGGRFLKDDWLKVSPEDKEAIAVYLKSRTQPVNLRGVISKETYQYYVRKGKRVLRLAASSQGAP